VEQCTDMFDRVFGSGGGGCRGECFCGREYFNPDGGWDWGEGELENLRALAEENPAKYFEVDYTVGTMYIDGKTIIYGCSCDIARRYEQFIINHDEQIAQYLNERAAMLHEKADKITVSRG
jgi:hypothetical protein